MKPDIQESIETFIGLIKKGEAFIKNQRFTFSPSARVLEMGPMKASLLGCAVIGHSLKLGATPRGIFQAAYGLYVNFRDEVSESDPPEIRECFAVGRITGLPTELLFDLNAQAANYRATHPFAQFLRAKFVPREYPDVREFDAAERKRLAQKK